VNINLTLFVQMIVFIVLIWFTMKFVWPMILGPMEERSRKIAVGIARARKAAGTGRGHQRAEIHCARGARARANRWRNRRIAATMRPWRLQAGRPDRGCAPARVRRLKSVMRPSSQRTVAA